MGNMQGHGVLLNQILVINGSIVHGPGTIIGLE